MLNTHPELPRREPRHRLCESSLQMKIRWSRIIGIYSSTYTDMHRNFFISAAYFILDEIVETHKKRDKASNFNNINDVCISTKIQ
jgi:hypothetical protein